MFLFVFFLIENKESVFNIRKKIYPIDSFNFSLIIIFIV